MRCPDYLEELVFFNPTWKTNTSKKPGKKNSSIKNVNKITRTGEA